MVRDPSRRRLALADRLIEVIDDRQTGETLLDEALKMMKSSEKYGTGAWVDLMSGTSNEFLQSQPQTQSRSLRYLLAHNHLLITTHHYVLQGIDALLVPLRRHGQSIWNWEPD
jgi:Golgi phosphoprotein 3